MRPFVSMRSLVLAVVMACSLLGVAQAQPQASPAPLSISPEASALADKLIAEANAMGLGNDPSREELDRWLEKVKGAIAMAGMNGAPFDFSRLSGVSATNDEIESLKNLKWEDVSTSTAQTRKAWAYSQAIAWEVRTRCQNPLNVKLETALSRPPEEWARDGSIIAVLELPRFQENTEAAEALLAEYRRRDASEGMYRTMMYHYIIKKDMKAVIADADAILALPDIPERVDLYTLVYRMSALCCLRQGGDLSVIPDLKTTSERVRDWPGDYNPYKESAVSWLNDMAK